MASAEFLLLGRVLLALPSSVMLCLKTGRTHEKTELLIDHAKLLATSCSPRAKRAAWKALKGIAVYCGWDRVKKAQWGI